MESLKGEEGKPRNLLFELIRRMDQYVETKYRSSRKPTEEARMDAMTFVAVNSGWFKLEPFIHPDYTPEEIARCDEIASKLDLAIKNAREGNWLPMRDYLQTSGHEARRASTLNVLMQESNPQVQSGEEGEWRAEALFNLARSLTP